MQPLEETKSALLPDKWRPHFIEKVPALVPNWSIFMQMKNPNCSCDLSKYHGPDWSELYILISLYGSTPIDLYRYK